MELPATLPLMAITLLAKFSLCCDTGNYIGDSPFCDKDQCDPCNVKSNQEEGQKALPSKAVRYIRGRLGNHLSGYMFALTIKLSFGIDVHIGRETADYIDRYFVGNRFPTAEESICGAEEYYREFKKELDRRVVEWYSAKAGSATNGTDLGIKRGDDGRLHIPRDLTDRYGSVSTYSVIDGGDFDDRWTKNFRQDCTYGWETFQKPVELLSEEGFSRNKVMLLFPANVMGNTGELSTRLEPNFTKILFGDLKFRPKFIRHSQETLHRIKKEHMEKLNKKKSDKRSAKPKKKIKKKPVEKDFVFVGIHCRRTDHLAFERDQMGVIPVDRHYYLDAMAAFRDHFAKSGAHVAFVFVSDDMPWGRQQLAATAAAGKSKSERRDLYFPGSGDGADPDAIGRDLALLAACNHTIQSYGTYSYFAGAFAGGFKIVPQHFGRYRSKTTPKSFAHGSPFKNPLPRLHFNELYQKQRN